MGASNNMYLYSIGEIRVKNPVGARITYRGYM
jgi:hypothetical protein